MSQKDARLSVSHKKITGVKKILKETDDSGPIATRARIAPTLAAVPVWRAVGLGPRPHTLNTRTILHPTPHIYKYIKFQNNPFAFKIRDPQF
jgi:hypothetical protein